MAHLQFLSSTLALVALSFSGALQLEVRDSFCVRIPATEVDLSTARGRAHIIRLIREEADRTCAIPQFGAYDQANEAECRAYFDAAVRAVRPPERCPQSDCRRTVGITSMA